MDIVIDETTGLPEVPEGLFWRIREKPTYRSERGNSHRTDNGELWVELCTEGMVKETYKTRPKLSWRNVWIYPLLKKSVTALRTVPGVVVKAETVMAEYAHATRYDSDVEKLKAKGYREANYLSYYSDSLKYVRHMDATPEVARELATLVLAKYNAEEERRTAARKNKMQRVALIGTYPPKKLSDIDD